MDNNFEVFKSLDNDEIYGKTYITVENLDAIKNKNFEYFTRFKLMGFIDILSKRLNLDLSELRIEANQYFDSIEPVVEIEEPKKEQLAFSMNIDKKIIFIAGVSLVVLVLIVSLYFVFTSEAKKDLTDVQVSPPSNVVVTPPIKEIMQEQNTTADQNVTDKNIVDANLSTPVLKVEKSSVSKDDVIKIIPTKKIWIGIINLDTKEKKDYTTANELIIDKSKNQIIVINGAYLSLLVGDTEKKYDYEGRVRFICKDGKIEETSYTNFKALNNGKAWN